MSAKDFGRPGSASRPPPKHWPYHAPAPVEVLPDVALVVTSSRQRPERAPRRRSRVVAAVLLGGVVGAVLGGFWVSDVVMKSRTPEPVPIQIKTFPEELMGSQRNDLSLRRAGFGPTVERLDEEFAEQLAAFRFAYGGDGASLSYGRLLNLTIVNGILSPTLPRDGEVNRDGRANQTRRMISLRSGEISCIFEPEPVLNPESSVDRLGDFTSDGRTDCVLVDTEQNLSLQLINPQVVRGVDALDNASEFRDELQRIHADLVS